jgi:hypothetical protein
VEYVHYDNGEMYTKFTRYMRGKFDSKENSLMIQYSDEYEAHIFETNNIIFCWDDKPGEDAEEIATRAADFYLENIDIIAQYILDEIPDTFEVSDIEEIKEKIGRPLIYIESGLVAYCEQQFDDIHVICFEYLDDEFKELDCFALDG